jgi:hypothetical protein
MTDDQTPESPPVSPRDAWSVHLRKSADVTNIPFPFFEPLVTLLCIDVQTQTITQACSRVDKEYLLAFAVPNPACVVLAAWPGKLRQDIFLVTSEVPAPPAPPSRTGLFGASN